MAPYGYGYPAAAPLVHGESSVRAERNQRRRDMNYRSRDEVSLFIYILFYFFVLRIHSTTTTINAESLAVNIFSFYICYFLKIFYF